MSFPLDIQAWRGADVPRQLESFPEASMELLSTRALLRRVDRKYLMSRQTLDRFLSELAGDYRALRTAGRLGARYHTTYFDTIDRRMYDDHRRGRRPRFKVRARHHVDRGMSFVEIKCKGADEKTRKSVLERPFGTSGLDAEALRFVDSRSPFPGRLLAPTASMVFSRATLVGDAIDERITLDWGLEIFDDASRESLPRIVIVEVKQGRFSNRSPAVRAMRRLGVGERSVSKYCLATARLADVRVNTFKEMLLAVEKLPA